jgi:hypothetical protein
MTTVAKKALRKLRRAEDSTSSSMRKVREKVIGKERASKTLGGLSDESKLERIYPKPKGKKK